MSLINDALRRAKDAQPKAPPPAPGPQFRPIEPAQTAKQGIGIVLPVGIILIVLIGVAVVWLIRPKPVPIQAAVAPRPAAVNPVPETRLQPTPPASAVAIPAPAPSAAPAVAARPVEPAPVAPVTVTTPPPPALKLQAIFFSPGHSSAIISGKTVRAGDTLKGFRVVAVTENSATLISATETNVMVLEQ